MEYLALYRKYRPSALEEMVGQSEIRKIIASSIKNGTISHAYLFSGPRGTGKTTTAKIMAKMVNCEHLVDDNPCNECASCLSVISGSDIRRDNDTPQNGGDYSDDNHTSFISQGQIDNTESWDEAPIIERLDKISSLYQQVMKKWCDEFKGLFIEGGNIHEVA